MALKFNGLIVEWMSDNFPAWANLWKGSDYEGGLDW